MTSRDFVFWLQGHFEVSGKFAMNEHEGLIVARHLALVFKHEIDPSLGGNAEELQAVHDGMPGHSPSLANNGGVMRC